MRDFLDAFSNDLESNSELDSDCLLAAAKCVEYLSCYYASFHAKFFEFDYLPYIATLLADHDLKSPLALPVLKTMKYVMEDDKVFNDNILPRERDQAMLSHLSRLCETGDWPLVWQAGTMLEITLNKILESPSWEYEFLNFLSSSDRA